MLRRLMRTSWVLGSFLLLAGCASTKSGEAGTSTAAQATPLKQPGEAALGDRTTCPVSGEVFTVAADSPKVEYEGRTYYFCCEDCVGDFQKDPPKYLSKFGGT
jgi:YHS domain-containing protein